MFVVVVAILLFCWHDYFQGVNTAPADGTGAGGEVHPINQP